MSDDARERLARVRAGQPLDYSYDVYGAGRVSVVVSWDAATSSFIEARTDHDMDGSACTSRSAITEEQAERHVRAAATG